MVLRESSLRYLRLNRDERFSIGHFQFPIELEISRSTRSLQSFSETSTVARERQFHSRMRPLKNFANWAKQHSLGLTSQS
jgi:hypothetical protein